MFFLLCCSPSFLLATIITFCKMKNKTKHCIALKTEEHTLNTVHYQNFWWLIEAKSRVTLTTHMHTHTKTLALYYQPQAFLLVWGDITCFCLSLGKNDHLQLPSFVLWPELYIMVLSKKDGSILHMNIKLYKFSI